MNTADLNRNSAQAAERGGADGYVLQARHICKEFSGVQVLKDVDFNLCPGEVHALLGENGAGKSTLMKILSGAYTRTSGEILVDGVPVDIRSRHDAEMAGIGMIFQEFSQVKQLSVAENLYLNNYPHMGGALSPVDWKEMNRIAKERFASFGIEIDPTARVSELGVAKQQIVEIVKAMLGNTKILIMDEPTSSLTESEIETMFGFVREIKRRGIAIVYISHRMEEIAQICDRATILRDGRIIKTVDAQTPVEDIVALMIGRELRELYPVKSKTSYGSALIETQGLTSGKDFSDISITVRSGEIVGLAGLVGAGKTELCTTLYGLNKNYTGSYKIRGKEAHFKNVGQAKRAGIALVPENRQRQGVVTILTASENIGITNLALFKNRFRRIRLNVERETVARYFNEIDIRPKSPNKKAKYFSGGNQQKIVISKWLCSQSDIMIFDEPTRGIDVGARSEIYKIIQDLADKGAGVIVSSSDVQEVLGICDTIYVLSRGRINGCFKHGEATYQLLHKAINE